MNKNQMYAAIFNGVKDGIVLVNKQTGRVVECNSEFENLTGRKKKELIDMKVWDLRPEEMKEEAKRFFSKVSKVGTVRSDEVIFEKPDGKRTSIELISNVIKFGNNDYLCAVVRDNTEKKSNEKELKKYRDHLQDLVNERTSELSRINKQLKRSEKRYHSIFTEAKDGIVLIDISTKKIVDCNPEFERQTGRKLRELKKMYIWELRPPEKIEAAKQRFEIIMKKGFGRSSDLELQKPDGEMTYIDFVTKKQKIGNKYYSHSISRDITDKYLLDMKIQKMLEEERKLRLQLESEIKKRHEFSQALIHELKTPLTAILLSTESLKKKQKSNMENRLIENIDAGTIHLEKRINELLDITKGEIGLLTIKPQTLGIIEEFDEISKAIFEKVHKNNQTIAFDIPKELITVWADPDRFQQIITNLIDNAIKFNKINGRILVVAKRLDSNVVFTVKDEGCGIDKGNQEKIFKPYFRIEQDDRSGLGLGLSLAKMLVELHNGEMWVESEKGKGSAFSFSLPIQ